MNADEQALVNGLGAVLRGADDLRRPPWRGSPNYVAGHCYVVSEAFYHLTGGADSPWRPMQVRHEDSSHWFLRHRETDEILDLTALQFDTPVPYDEARGKGFLTRQPSRRCRVMIRRLPGTLVK